MVISIFLCFLFLSFHICLRLKCPNPQWYKISMTIFCLPPKPPKWGQKRGWKDHWTRRHQGLYSVCPTPARHVWVHTASQVVALSFISWAVKWGYWYLLLPLNQKRQFYVKESWKASNTRQMWGNGTKQVCKATWNFMQTVNGAERRGGWAMDIESSTSLLKTTEATVGSTQTNNIFQTM